MILDSLVDSHLHLWDPTRFRYPWLSGVPLLNRRYSLDDYDRATTGLPIEAMVFMQCEAEPSLFEREAAWVSDQAKIDRRIRGLVAWAPLEKGEAVGVELEQLTTHNLLRGIRRIIQFESDPDFCLRPAFIDGVRLLKRFGLSFDLCVDYRQMGRVIELARKLPEVVMILDHIGKPAIKEGIFALWSDQLRELARCPNVVCKISGVATEADHGNWTPGQLKPYISSAIDAFGFERILFGSDWPVSTQAIRYEQWVRLLKEMLTGVSASDQRKFWRDNAMRIYRL